MDLTRLENVKERMEQAANRAGRDVEDVKLIPVSKYHSIDKIKELMEIGIYTFGESRAQELRDKQEILSEEINWHFIGHLQRNKVKYIIRMPNCEYIHSLDSMRLAKKIQHRCELEETEIKVLVQVNVANDDDKFGILARNALEYIEKVAKKFDRIKIKGLMTILPHFDDPEDCRPYFRKLKELSQQIGEANIPGVEMKELSMGMTNDFEVAIEEGATMIRVGSGIFGPRNYDK